VSQNTLVKVTT